MVEFRDSYGILKLIASKSLGEDLEDITIDTYSMASHKTPIPVLKQLLLTLVLVVGLSILLKVNSDQNAFFNKNNRALFAMRVVAARSLHV